MSFRSLLEAAMGNEEEEEAEEEEEEEATEEVEKQHNDEDDSRPKRKKRKTKSSSILSHFTVQLPPDVQRVAEKTLADGAEDEQAVDLEYIDDEDDDEQYVDEEGDEDNDDDDEEKDEEDSDVERQLLGRRAKKLKAKAQRGRPGRRVRRVKIPPELNGVLGEANMLYASQQYDKAIVLLKDFIKKAPMIPDPYHTLGMIYEDRKDRAKALQFFLIACTLTPQDSELWKRVGRIAQEENNADQAMFCFKKACSANPKDQEAFFIYAEFCKQTGDHRRAAETLKKLAGICPDDLSLWIQAAEEYHFNDQQDEAVDALKTCIEKASAASATSNSTGDELDEEFASPSSVELNAVNMLADLYITLRKYREAILIIQNLYARHASATTTSTETEAQTTDPQAQAAVGLPIDIAVKYGICYLYERDFATAEAMFEHLFEQDVAVYGDLYADVADAYIAVKQDEKAISVLEKLLDRTEFAMDDIFRKYAECHQRMSNPTVALEFFEKAIRFQFDNESLRVDPELVLKAVITADEIGQPEKAIELLETCLPEVFVPPIRPHWANMKKSRRRKRNNANEPSLTEDEADTANDTDDNDDEDDDEDKEDDGEEADSQPQFDDPSLSLDAMENSVRLKLLIRWAYLKQKVGDPEKLCQVGIPVILACVNQSPRQVGKNAMEQLMNPDDGSMGFEVLKSEYLVDITNPAQRDSLQGVVIRVAHQVVVARILPNLELYKLVRDVALTLTQLGKPVAAIELLTDVNTSDKIEKEDWRFEIRFLALVIALAFEENRMAYECAKLNIVENPKHLGYWSLFARVIAITGVFSYHQKFLAKMLQEDPSNYPAMILAGHRSAAWDIASLTIGELTLAHLRQPQDPLILFCIGLSFLSASMQRTVNDRQLSVAKAFAFLQKYQEMRLAAAAGHEDEQMKAKDGSTKIESESAVSAPVLVEEPNKQSHKENDQENIQSQKNKSPVTSGIEKRVLQLECWYNMGRAHQQLGLFHLAIPMYERVLRFFELENPIESRYHLCRETAYNLSLIYKKSGADDLARYLIRRYLTLDDDDERA